MPRQAWAFADADLARPAAAAAAAPAAASTTVRQLRPPVALDAWFVNEVLPLEPLLLGYLRRHLRPGHGAGEAADLRQDVFVRAFEAAAVQRPQDTRAFVMTIARNLLIDHARRAQVVAIDALEDLGPVAEPACDAPAPDQVLAAREELQLLAQALDTLPPGCRKVVELRKIAGMSQSEVAQHLGIAENTVEKQVSKGMRALANFLMLRDVDLGRSLFGRRAAAKARVCAPE